MPTTFHWLAADRNGRLARFDAERWGTIPRAAPLLFETEQGKALWRSVHRAWVNQIAPLEVFEHRDLVMVPESEAPHLVAFARTPPPVGGERISARVVRFERAPRELLSLIEDQLDAEDPDVVGSLAIDEESFSAHPDSVLFRFSRWGDDPRYHRTERTPRFQLRLEDEVGLTALQVDFQQSALVDLNELLRPDQRYELGR